jgi:ubiquinone/menaquinone biosynthesis C-methylase UbiE
LLDLGSGGGFDSFAAQQVGDSGSYRYDMTAEMISKARAHVNTSGYRNVEFRLGEIENMPVADGMDVIPELRHQLVGTSPEYSPRRIAS